MGISFDLSVEDLPDGIFDAVVAAGYHKQDPYTIGRWDGIRPVTDSWIVNDIQVANNTVLICGSYLAEWDAAQANERAGSGIYKNPDTGELMPEFQTYQPLTLAQLNQTWRDGFFAAVSFDWIDNLAAWHLVCTRSALELGPAITGFVDPLLDEGGLYSMVIDYRTLVPGGGQTFLYVTAVGYTGVGGLDISGYNYLGSPPPFDEAAYIPYQYSVFQNQDYYPQMFSFLVAPYESTINNPGDTWTPNGRVNPYLNKSGQPIQLNTVQLAFTGVQDYLSTIDSNFVDLPQDQLGQTMHLEYFDFTTTPIGSPLGEGIFPADWSLSYFVYYDVALAPLEQYTYRGHQIGVTQMPMSQVLVANPYGRGLPGQNYYPTSTFSIAPIIKPIEFTMAVPGYQIYEELLPDSYPRHPENAQRFNGLNRTFIQSDGHIWRHGFIPRKLKSIYRTQSVLDNYGGQQFTVGNDTNGPFDALGTLVIGGECLVQDRDARSAPIAGQAKSTGGVLDYEPLLLYGQNGLTNGTYANQILTDIGVFFAFTKRNFCIEDVTAGGTVNSSLDNASVELIAPCLNVNTNVVNTYPVLLCVQITDPDSRAEIMIFQPDLVAFGKGQSPFKFVQDTKVVGPYASKGGVWETATGLELGTTWHNVGSQPDPFTQRELSSPSNSFNIKTYSNKGGDIYDPVGSPTGRSIILGGNTTRRTPQGTWALAYDTGSLDAQYLPRFNVRTPPTPLINPLEGFNVLKATKQQGSGSAYGPQELDYYDKQSDTQLFQQFYLSRFYHIPNESMQYQVAPPVTGWEWRTTTGSILEGLDINGYRFGLIRAGATLPSPSGFYSSLQNLVDGLNAELAYIKSDITTEASLPTPTGLLGITFAITSDNKGVYAETDSQYFVTDPLSGLLQDPTQFGGKLAISDPLQTWNVQENYPYCTDPLPGDGLIQFPWDKSDFETFGQAATVSPLLAQDFGGCFLDIGELLDNAINPPKPITVGSERFFMSADYDHDRDQWLISLTDITEKFTVLAATTDFSEILDQTSSIEQLPANRGEGLLLALNQKTNALDGVAFAGDYKPIHGVSNDKAYKITGTTGRTVKVFLNYMLYDGLDSMIAVELSNLGLSVTPENVLWYKTTILNANADQEVTLEEIESWMDLQKQQYQEMLKNRKPIQRDTGSDPKVDDYILDDKSIADLLPELDRLPPNPDSNPTDADMMGNTLSGDIKSVEEKRRESDF